MTEAVRVLIVEDSEAERFFLRRTIAKCRPGAEVVEFSYAEEALAHLGAPGSAAFDNVFVDINMPRMDGFDFATRFADLAPAVRGTARLWVVSHSIDPADRARAEAHPAIDGFLPKTYGDADIDRILPRAKFG